jgi:hypothetical protein
MTPEQLKARNEAIRKAWTILYAARSIQPGSPDPDTRYASQEAYNAYFRNYRAKRKAAP